MSDTATATATATDEFLRRYLADRDAECPGCGYNVRGLTTDICPECGQALVLSLRVREPKQAAMIAGLVGLSMGAGFGGLLLVYLAIVIIVGSPGTPPEMFWIVNTAGLIVHGVAIAGWLRYWTAIRRISFARRALLVTICWLLPLAFVTLFTIALQ